jgi:hypothetical protein
VRGGEKRSCIFKARRLMALQATLITATIMAKKLPWSEE